MSNSVAPHGAEKPIPLNAMFRKARYELGLALRKIEDAIDRIDPPQDADRILVSSLDYFQKQLLEIADAHATAIVMTEMMRWVHKQIMQTNPDVLDSAADADDDDIVILPPEEGGAA